MPQSATLSARQTRFIEALLAHATVKQAAEACHINPCTAHRWFKDPAFQELYRAEQRTLHQANMAKLIKFEDAAINCLLRNLNAKSEFVQVQSASKLLELTQDAYKTQELEAEIAELRSLLEAKVAWQA